MPVVGCFTAWAYSHPRGRQHALGRGDISGLAALRLGHCGFDLGGELRTRGKTIERRSLEDVHELRNGRVADAVAKPDRIATVQLL